MSTENKEKVKELIGIRQSSADNERGISHWTDITLWSHFHVCRLVIFDLCGSDMGFLVPRLRFYFWTGLYTRGVHAETIGRGWRRSPTHRHVGRLFALAIDLCVWIGIEFFGSTGVANGRSWGSGPYTKFWEYIVIISKYVIRIEN